MVKLVANETLMNEPDWTLVRYRPLLHLYVRQIQLGRRLRRGIESSDIVQDALLGALQGLDKFRGKTEAELVAWLRVLTRNKVIDKWREDRVIPEEDTNTPIDAFERSMMPGPSTIVIGRENVLILAAAIDQLPDTQRDAVICHFLLALPIAETASRLKKNDKCVAMLVFRGKQRLKEILGRTGCGQ
jgi:RNA polymerase sigma-70 factor (ECF subfamily)